VFVLSDVITVTCLQVLVPRRGIPQPPFKFLSLEYEFKLKSLLLRVFKKLK